MHMNIQNESALVEAILITASGAYLKKCFFSSKSNFLHVSAKGQSRLLLSIASNETNVNVQSHKNQNPCVDESRAANRRS